MYDDDWTMNYDDDLLLDYLEKEATQHQIIATENITKIWDKIETNIYNCGKNTNTTGNNVTKNFPPHPIIWITIIPPRI